MSIRAVAEPDTLTAQELGGLELEADTQLQRDISALPAVDAAAGSGVPPGVTAARMAEATLDCVRDLLSKEAFLAAVLLREQEVSFCRHTARSSR